MTNTLEDASHDVRRKCDPILHRIGLVGPTLVMANTYFVLYYFGADIGLQILVEFQDFFVYLLPFRQRGDGEIPVGYCDSHGQVQKMYLHEALEKLGLPHDKTRTELQRLGGDYRNCDAMLSILLGLTQKNWPKIVERHEFLFPRTSTPKV